MKTPWGTWILILSVLVAALLALNLQTPASRITAAPVFPDETRNLKVLSQYALSQSADVEPPPAPIPAVKTSLNTPVKAAPGKPAKSSVSALRPPATGTVKGAGPAVVEKKSVLVPGKFIIQAASFQNKQTAQAESQRAVSSGFAAYLSHVEVSAGVVRYRLCIGPFATRAEAGQALARVKKDYPGSFVMALKGK